MMKQNKLELDYHVNQKGESDPFCDLLTCYDQICYFEFRKVSDFNRWIHFCDDINLKIDDRDQVSVMRTMVNREYQRLERYEVKENYFCRIDQLISEHGAVMLGTAFNYAPDFVWWDEGKGQLHTEHMTYVIDADQEFYYIVDSPWVFIHFEQIRMETNPSIAKVRKERFAKAFEKCCKVYVFRFENLPVKREEEAVLLEKNIRIMIQNYAADLEDAHAGRRAYEYMKEKCALDQQSIFADSFPYHIMASRRLLLKRALQRWKDEVRNYSSIMKYLDQSIEHWRKMRLISSDYQYLKMEPSRRAGELLPLVIENEELLVQALCGQPQI